MEFAFYYRDRKPERGKVMRFTKYIVTAVIALSLVILPILPLEQAEAATNYNYRYTTNYYSYSVPVKYNTTVTTTNRYTNSYTIYYDIGTGKYYVVEKPSEEKPKYNPPQPNVPDSSNKTPTPVPEEKPRPQQPAPEQKPGNSQYEQRVVELVNQERAKAGLKPLTYDSQLSQVARLKSEDMRDKQYFSHNSPTYGSPFDMMKSQGISYRTAGENIAAGQSSPQQVVQAWMNSPGHRANILSNQYSQIGVGYASGGSYGHYWTQMFITK